MSWVTCEPRSMMRIFVVAGEPIGIGAAHEGGIEDGHPDLMCGARRVRSRPVFPPGKASREPCPFRRQAAFKARAIRQDPLPTARFRSPQPFSCLLHSL